MRKSWMLLLFMAGLFSCDENRIYDTNQDLTGRRWLATEKPEFEFVISDPSARYSIYCNIRNAVSYPYSRLFMNYELMDSTGNALQKNLVSAFLFDQKSGKPFGDSGLGDLYDQRIPLVQNYTFTNPGKYKVRLEQYMRTDTLQGVVAIGVRVEKAPVSK
jgi:gliding motility-associated lipoprotein GldH